MDAKILILDDDEKIQRILGQLLQKNGYRFATAGDTATARNLLKRQQFELILCNIVLPEESGLDFISDALSVYPHLAPIIITGYGNMESATKAIEIGVFDYITKPFEPERILYSVYNALKRRELRLANQAYSDNIKQMVSERTVTLEETNKRLRQEIAESVHTRDVLKASDQKYRLLVSSIPGFVYQGYKDWSVDFTDNKIEEMTGYNKQDFDARRVKWCDLMYKEDVVVSKKCIVEAINTGDAYIREYRIKTKTGQTLWIQDRGRIVRNAKGEIDYFSGIFFDITKQKQAEDELRQNERYYRSILKFMHESIMVVDGNYKITDVNTAFLTVTGRTRNAVLGQCCYEVSRGYDKPCDRYGEDCKLHEVFETGEPRQCLHEHLGAKGSKICMDISFSPLKDEQNKVTHVIQAMRDVTRQKRMEEALVQSEEKHRLLVTNASDAIFITQDETIKFANPKTEELSGYSVEELARIPIASFIHPEDRNMVLERYQKRLKGERFFDTYSFRILNKTGQEVWVQPKTTSIEWEGRPAALTFLRNVTELKQAEENKKQIEAQLLQAEKMASIGQLAAGVAHEINNPTGFVSSNLKTLSDYIKDISDLTQAYRNLVAELTEDTDSGGTQPDISGKVRHIKTLEEDADVDFILNDILELIEESREGTERIKSIIQDLKDFAHPGEDKPKFADINQNLDSTVNVVWNELKYKAEVIKDYGDLPEVHCYPQMLNQVFMNLLVNAAQAIEERGEIRIQTRSDNGYVAIKISDTGSGIPKEHLSRIFDPFFTTKDVGKGTGLGLNVVYNIIQKHRGTIDVESNVGAGTTFTMKIPTEPLMAEQDERTET